MKASSTYQVCVTGSPDFVRRMTAAARQQPLYGRAGALTITPTNLAEARSSILAERPHILVFDVGLRTSRRDLLWLRALLGQIRERFEREIYVILAVTAPEKFAYGGDLLFLDDTTLTPSGFIDNILVAAPAGIPSIPTLEEQLRDCLTYVVESFERTGESKAMLPALWEDDWVPVMCDPESRNVWMRWLPRYARYINENPIIVGPTGAGKTRLATAMHALSGRTGPFVSITPRDFSSTELVQAELFGAVAGAYTGAVEKWGLVRRAEKGTLFIDELQSIDKDLQGKLITFIENKTYRRVGEAESHTADVRFIFATNKKLQDLVDDGSLRDDFAYRLERLQVELSPLPDRRLDISAGICFGMAKVLRERAKARSRKTVSGSAPTNSLIMGGVEGISVGAYQTLFSASWPGNLRQLENTMAKLIELADIKHSRLIDRQSAYETLEGLLGQSSVSATEIFERAAVDVAIRARSEGFQSLNDCLFDFSERTRKEALELAGGDATRAADLIRDSSRSMKFFVASRTSAF